MTGYVKISRAIFASDEFADEPFSEREAFIWLITEAAYKPCSKRVGHVIVQLQRGQVMASTRFMAAAWQWSEARVRRYLGRLKDRRTIDAASDAGVTVITICNYNAYQSEPHSSDAPSERKSTQTIRSKEIDGGGGGARAHAHAHEGKTQAATVEPSPKPSHLADQHDEILAAAGIDPAMDVSGKWHGSTAIWTVQRWRALGLSQDEITTTIRECRNGGPPGSLAYYTAAMQRAAGRKTAPPLQPVATHGTRSPPEHRRLTRDEIRAAAEEALKHD